MRLYIPLAALALTACAEVGDDSGSAPEASSAPGGVSAFPITTFEDELIPPPLSDQASLFEGFWQSDCLESDEGGLRVTTQVVAGDSFSGSISYLDDECTQPLFETQLPNTPVYGETVQLADSSFAVEVDLLVGTQVLGFAPNALAASVLSDELRCGVDDWEANVVFDVTACEVADGLRVFFGREVPQIQSVFEDDFFVGQSTEVDADGVAIARPVQLNLTQPLRRTIR